MRKLLTLIIMIYIFNGCAEIPNNTKINLNNGAYKISEIKINGNKIKIAKSATFNIDNDRIYGNSGCNSYFAGFSRGSDSIMIGTAGATRMYCANEEDNQFENIYLKNLDGEFKISGDSKTIKLYNKNMEITLTR